MADEDKDQEGSTEDKDVDGEEKDKSKDGEGTSKPTAEQVAEELARTKRLLDIANKEAADRRKKLEAYEKAEEARKQAEMTELEKAQKLAEEAQAKAELAEAARVSALIMAAVQVAAVQANLHDPADAARLIDLSGIQVDDDGKVTGADEAMKALVKERPYLVKAASKPDIDGDKSGKSNKDEPERVEATKRRYGL